MKIVKPTSFLDKCITLRRNAIDCLVERPKHSTDCAEQTPAPCSCGAEEKQQAYDWAVDLFNKEFARLVSNWYSDRGHQ